MARIVSLLPAATEIAAALGLADQLVGVSHECDFPPEVVGLPRVTHCPLHEAGLASAEVDRRVRESLAAGENLYRIDDRLMRELRPDLVLSQGLCDVCAIGYGTVAALVATLPGPPRLLNLEPRRLADLYANIEAVADAAGVPERAASLNASLRARVHAVLRTVERASHRGSVEASDESDLPDMSDGTDAPTRRRSRVLFLEWLDPPFGSGHWTPELVELAGGECVIGVPGEPSRTLTWEEVAASRPQVIVIACCGYSAERARADLPIAGRQPGWAELPAVRAGQIHVLDGSQYFSRPGPRLIDSLELLAETLWSYSSGGR